MKDLQHTSSFTAANGQSSHQEFLRTQSTLNDTRQSALEKYRRIVVGSGGLWGLLKYELLTGLLGGMPGLLGLALRAFFYRFLFKQMGKNVVIGRNVTIRRPDRIRLGDGVVISDGVVLDAKGEYGEGIILEQGVFIGQGTILSMGGGTIHLEEQANVGSYCRIGTLGTTRIGRKVLLAANVYLIGGGHRSDRVDIPILDQSSMTRGGCDIGDGCWIGAFTGVLDGVKIGNDAIIGAHSLVTRDIPAFAVAHGIPARVQRDRRDAYAKDA